MTNEYENQDLQNLNAKEKTSDEYFMEMTDRIIADLVYDKDHLKKAYNYYNGVRDEDQFRHLEENFGIGTPTSVQFTPLVRGHIDVLIGEHLQNKIKPYITCKDKQTLSKINDEKMKFIYTQEINTLKTQLANNLSYMLMTEEEKQAQAKPFDAASEEKIKKMRTEIERDYISEFERAAYYALNHLIQSKDVDLYDKLRLLFLDLLVAGQCYYKVVIPRLGATPRIDVLNPFDVFYERNLNHKEIKFSHRAINRRWMNRQQIITEYGRYLSEEDIESLRWELGQVNTGTAHYVRACGGGLIANTGISITPTMYGEDDINDRDYNLYPVYEVEWLANNKFTNDQNEPDYKTERYESVRIGESLYVNMKKSENVTEVKSRPYVDTLSINGTSYDDRGAKPHSLVLMTAHLQDKYDIMNFHVENLIASSGIKGDWIDVGNLPVFLGSSPAERIAKFKAYKKQGLAPIDTSQAEAGVLNTTFGGYDDTVSGDSVQAILLNIQQIEETCSRITGVFRERLGGIEQRDAVSNVEVGIKQSAIITKQYYKMMDGVTVNILVDALDACKISYAKGKTGSLILGNKLQQVFTIDGKKFSMTDYDVHIADSGDMIKNLETIKSVSTELIKGGAIDIDVALEALVSESLTDMKENVSRAYKEKKAENDQLQQAMQQVEQLQQQLQQAQQEAQKAAVERDTLAKQADQIRQQEIDNRYRIESERNRITEEKNDGDLEVNNKKVEIELAQLYDNNPLNNKVKF